MGIFQELKRRNVFRVSVAYLIVSWLVAQIADLVLDNIGAPEWVMQSLLLLMAMGFAAALIISWAYEITPEGIKRERDVIRDDSITHLTARKLDYITIAAVVGVAVMFGLRQNGGEEPVAQTTRLVSTAIETGDHSIAVLPFANRSNRDEDLFFTDGIHDDLLTQLAKISDLKVISRTSVMQYRDTEKRIPEIAAELGVSTILEGGVQRAGQRIRINAQLIDVATDEHIWAETFDREMTIDNLFDIQSEITRQIVTAVKGELSAVEQVVGAVAPTQNLEAFEAYLHARGLLSDSGYNLEKYTTSLPYAEKAVALDPEFAKAHLLLAKIYAQMIWLGYDISPQRELAARTSLQKAAAILPDGSPELLAMQGEFLYRFEQDYPAALKLYLQSHAAMPGNVTILVGLSFTQRRLGLWEESVNSLLKIVELDPANANAVGMVAENLAMMQQWERLGAYIALVGERIGGNADFDAVVAGFPLWSTGDVKTARQLISGIRPNNGLNYLLLATELPWFERDFAAVIAIWDLPEIVEQLSLAGNAGYREVNIAEAYQHMGELERAAKLLEKVEEQLVDMDRDRLAPLVAYELGTLARILVLQGKNERAIATMEEAARVIPPESDDIDGNLQLQILSWVLAMSGERDQALQILSDIIGQPAGPAPWGLYLDPRWDFFRDDERFNDLIRPHNLEQSEKSSKQ